MWAMSACSFSEMNSAVLIISRLVNTEFAVLKVTFPSADVEEMEQLVFSDVCALTLTMTFVSKDCQILSVPDRMFCVAFARIETWTTILQVVLDWSTGLSTYIDMDITYVRAIAYMRTKFLRR